MSEQLLSGQSVNFTCQFPYSIDYVFHLMSHTSAKKQGQKYQNKTAFKVTFNPKAQETHSKVPLTQLCEKCVKLIQWKMQFNKYRPLTTPARCPACGNKAIVSNYRTVCNNCAKAKNSCSKCLEQGTVQVKQQTLNENLSMKVFMSKLRQRSLRRIQRGLQKGTVEWVQDHFEEDGKPVVGLYFKNNEDEDVEEIQDEDW